MNDCSRRHWTGSILLLTCLLALVGCSDGNQIRRYTVEKPVPTDRMLAAIIPHSELAWFFKLSGPNETLAGLTETFFEFIDTVRISDDEPTWDLPSGWVRTPGSQTRFATIQISSQDEPLDLSVTRLPKMADETQLLLQNINRWRGQLQLPPLTEDLLPDESVKMELDAETGLTATLINIVGNLKGGGSGGAAPFAAAGAPRAGPFSGSPMSTVPKKTIEYATPEGWQPGQLVVSRGGISIARDAAFEVIDGNARAEITVTQLPASEQSLQQNVNRWRQQVGLAGDASPSELKDVDVLGVRGVSMELIGPQQAILGVIAVDGGLGWFVKLWGDRDLALRERERFQQFVGSIQFKGEQ